MTLLLSHFSHVRLCATPETAAHQAPPSLGFSMQEYWTGLPSKRCLGLGFAWRIPGTGEPGGLPSLGWHRVGHD